MPMFIDTRVAEPGKSCIVFSACHGVLVRHALLLHIEEFKENSAVHFCPSWEEDIDAILAVAPQCDYFIVQAEQLPVVKERIARIRAQLPPTAVTAYFPPIGFTPLWPDLFRDWSAPIDPELNKPLFPFADRRIISLIKKGVPRNRVVDEYLSIDVAKAVNIDRLLEVWKVNSEAFDAQCDCALTDILENNIRERLTFFSTFHCANFVVFDLIERLADKLGLTISRPYPEAPELLRDYEHPVHPSMISHFGIKYLTPETRYLMLRGDTATFTEHCERYIDYVLARTPELVVQA